MWSESVVVPDGPAPAPEPACSLAAVVVNYRAVEHVLSCVASLAADGIDQIVVVDNASGDDCRQRLAASHPDVAFVGLDRNLGYGAAANRGATAVAGDAVLVCNPDLVVSPGTAAALANALAGDPTLGAVGPRINRPDGTRYPSARTFPSIVDAAGHGFIGLFTAANPFSRRYLRSGVEEDRRVDWVSGACMAVRRRAFEQVGGFDESFFMFMEDVDLCWRLARAGWHVGYEPAAVVTHLEGASRAAAPYRMILAHHRSLFRYGRRTATGWNRAWLPAVAVGLVVRTAYLCLRQAFRSGHRRYPDPLEVLEG